MEQNPLAKGYRIKAHYLEIYNEQVKNGKISSGFTFYRKVEILASLSIDGVHHCDTAIDEPLEI